MNKRAIRAKYLSKRKTLDKNFVDLSSNVIVDKIIENLASPDNILFYLPYNNEVDLSLLPRKIKARKFFVPAYLNESWLISEYKSGDELTEGFKEILQPKKIIPVDIKDVDVALVPGIAFSKNGQRLGYGYGVFDRILKNSNAFKIGVCFEFQIVEDFTFEAHDINMDMVVTESNIYKASEYSI